LDKPVLTSADPDVRWWENKKQFKSTVIWDKAKTTGYPFVMYYNANGDSAKNNVKTRWYERIGMAVSNNMVEWQRFQAEPVVHHPVGITGDPFIQKIGNVWVMFYFGAFWEGRTGLSTVCLFVRLGTLDRLARRRPDRFVETLR
jgi:hypothetical protein